ncbi:TetR family transcriptional regulator [Streptomyces sp. VRA16 Mangrove soil]|uniref:TetR/AcrR family transcriptional regulator n=1 Tax=Streptomyces sp. VRA16 Mangrove soil TaxID=2817434 RepID=UPI001A9F89D7|nr:TetR family transcriptional regulator [Streptomyces sp. VRA16 Mangrove soil]MBO1331817.1 TetR family transcriptional regulator [Streptomyces sp. VRA16 Mangrove soil]
MDAEQETAPDNERRRARSHDPEGNRRAVLAAARRLFAAHGYQGASIRAIAAESGVTPGLVMAYFGSKDGLFRAVVGEGTGVTAHVLDAAGNDPAGLPQALAHSYLDRWDRLSAQDPLAALIRSALSHPPSAEQLAELLDRLVTGPLTGVLGDSHEARTRIGLIRSILFGVIMERYLFAHEPARSVPTEELEPLLAAVLATAVGTPATARAPAVPPQDPAPATDADTRVFAALTECAARYRTLIGRVVKRHGIGLAAFEVLAELRRAPSPRTMTELAAAGAVRAGGMTQHADRLARAGLIERERDAQDRRVVRLRLTTAGRALVDEVAGERRAAERQLLGGLRPDERRRLGVLLNGMGRVLAGAASEALPDAAP